VYFRDNEQVKKHLKQEGFEVVTASSEIGDCWVTGQPPGGARIQAEMRVADVNPADFAGVLFTGSDTAEFTDDPSSKSFNAVATILKEMESSGRVVGAICLGQQVLLKFGVLRGRTAAGCGRIGKPAYLAALSDPLAPGRVHTDRRVVTAAGSYDSKEFAEEVLNELRK
jgi:putative intracellular protease/amidase